MNHYREQPHKPLGRVRDSHLEYPRIQSLDERIDAEIRAERRERVVDGINRFTEVVGKMTRATLRSLGVDNQEDVSSRTVNIRTGRRTILAVTAAAVALGVTIGVSDTEPVAYDSVAELQECVDTEISIREFERREGIVDHMTTEEFTDLAAASCFEEGIYPFDVNDAVQIVREDR